MFGPPSSHYRRIQSVAHAVEEHRGLSGRPGRNRKPQRLFFDASPEKKRTGEDFRRLRRPLPDAAPVLHVGVYGHLTRYGGNEMKDAHAENTCLESSQQQEKEPSMLGVSMKAAGGLKGL